MFILPYVSSSHILSTVVLHRIRLLTVGGTGLWQEDNALRLHEDILEPNDLPLLSHHQHKDIYFCRLDPDRMNLSEYYDWEEVVPSDTTVFCWRTFYVMEPLPPSPSLPPSLLPSLPPSSLLPPPSTVRLGPYTWEELLTHLKPGARIHI